jgi:hypothetical protein
MENVLINTLGEVAKILDKEGIPYAITGSVASSVFGEPFVSEDVDLVLHATPKEAGAIARQFPPRFYAPEDMLVEAAQKQTLANAIDNRTGLKVDLSFVPRTGFFAQVIAHRIKVQIGSDGPVFSFVTPEDVILMKLLWRKDSRSQKQWDNALSVAKVRGASLDWKYLFEQAEHLGLKADLEKLRDEAGV